MRATTCFTLFAKSLLARKEFSNARLFFCHTTALYTVLLSSIRFVGVKQQGASSAQLTVSRLCELFGLSHPGRGAEAFSSVNRVAGAELFFDAKKLIVLGQTFRSAGGTGLDLSGAQSHRQIGNVRVFRFTRTVRSHHTPSGLLGHLDGVDRFRNGSDLIDFQQQARAGLLVHRALDLFNVGNGQVVTDHLEGGTVLGGEPVCDEK